MLIKDDPNDQESYRHSSLQLQQDVVHPNGTFATHDFNR